MSNKKKANFSPISAIKTKTNDRKKYTLNLMLVKKEWFIPSFIVRVFEQIDLAKLLHCWTSAKDIIKGHSVFVSFVVRGQPVISTNTLSRKGYQSQVEVKHLTQRSRWKSKITKIENMRNLDFVHFFTSFKLRLIDNIFFYGFRFIRKYSLKRHFNMMWWRWTHLLLLLFLFSPFTENDFHSSLSF